MSAPAGLVLRYGSAAELRRDRLPDVKHGVLLRTKLSFAVGERPPVTIELDKERVTIQATGDVQWLTPLVHGALVGVALTPVAHRDGVQLDLAFGIRTAGPPPEKIDLPPPPPMPAEPPRADGDAPAVANRPLSVAMLQPNPVLRQVLATALARYGREKGRCDVAIDASEDADGFLEALSSERRGLAVIDGDALGPATEGVLAAIRSHAGWERLPVILLSSEGRSRLEDSYAVSMRKPFEVKAFVDLTGILVATGG